MAFKFNPFTGQLDIVETTLVSSSDPSSGYNGQFLINTTSGTLKVYYSGSWYTIYTFGVVTASHLLLENSDTLAMENGDQFTLE